jgi:aminopeptidase N
MNSNLIFILTTVLLAGLQTQQASAALDRTDINVEHYDLEYSLSLGSKYIAQNSLTGSASLRLTNVGDAPIDQLPLLLNRLMRFERVTGGDGQVFIFEHRIRELANFEFYQANTAVVTFPAPLQPGSAIEITIEFGGRLTGYADAGMAYTKETLDPAFTILRSETLAWPQIAEPDWLDVRAGWADDFDWQATVEVPDTHMVANGELMRAEHRGDRNIYHYRKNSNKTFMIFAIAPYQRIRVGGHRVYSLPGSEPGAKLVTKYVNDGLDQFEEWFGPIPGDGGLAIIEIPEGYGSQAIFPTIIQTADAFNSEEHADQVYHELSHLWDVAIYEPTCERLEEGLATFMQGLVDAKLGGKTSLDSFMASVLKSTRQRYERNPALKDIAIADFGREGVTYLSYGVGALFYYELYKSLGEEAFIELLAGFYERHRENGADFDMLSAYFGEHLDGEAAVLVEEWLVGTSYVEHLFAAP